MDAFFITIIGTTAAIFQALRIIPQVYKGFRTKHVRDIAVLWIILGLTSTILWLIYGFLRQDHPLLFANFINICCYILLIVQKRVYHEKPKEQII